MFPTSEKAKMKQDLEPKTKPKKGENHPKRKILMKITFETNVKYNW